MRFERLNIRPRDGGLTKSELSKMHNTIADEIYTMPPYRQSIILRADYSNILRKDRGGIFCGANGRIVLGWDYTHRPYPKHFSHHEYFREQNLKSLLHHEDGHRIDWMMGGKRKDSQYWSDQSDDWKQALECQLKRRPVLLKGSDEYKLDGLYPTSRPLEGHLSACSYKEQDYPREAFAEMVTHHGRLYAMNHGDEASISKILSASYPELWEVFEAQALPEMKSLAQEFEATARAKPVVVVSQKCLQL